MPKERISASESASSATMSTSSMRNADERRSCWKMIVAIGTVASGALLFLTGLLMYTVIVPNVVDSSIEQNSRLIEGSLLMQKWQRPEYKMQFKLHVLSIKNPDEFMNGAIPEVTSTGPYTFDEKLENRIISAANGTVKYRKYMTWHFNEKDSCQTCILGNRIWVPNMIYQKFVEAASTNGMRAAATTLLSQTAFLEVEVNELLFEGYKDPFLDKVCEIPFMNFVCESILDVPDRIGIFFEKNNTGGREFVVEDGTENVEDLGKIVTYDGEKHLDDTWWDNEEARRLRGTDGNLFKPFIQKTDKLYVFVTEWCRTIWLVYEKEVVYKGLNAYRFVMPPEVFDPEYPGNEGYCNPTDKRFFKSQNETGDCWPKGLLEISKCQRSQPPIMISLPNFLFSTEEVQKSVKGLNVSDVNRDGIIVDIEPRIGTVLSARRRSQVNIEMWKGKDLTFPINLKKMKSSLIPVLIVNEDVEIDDNSLEEIRSQLYEAEWWAYASCNVLMIVGALILIVGLILLAYVKKNF